MAIQDATKTVPVFCRLYLLRFEALYGAGTIIDNVAKGIDDSIRSGWDGWTICCWWVVEEASEGDGRPVNVRNVENEARTSSDVAGLWMNMSASAHGDRDRSRDCGPGLEKIGKLHR